MSVKTYLVTAEDLAPARISELATRLREAGFSVTQQLDAAGVIIGSADEAALPGLRSLPGVAAIEEQRSYQLPPDGNPTGGC